MNKIRFTIGRKIFAAFFLLIIIFTLNATLSIITIQKSGSIIKESSEVVKPSLDAIEDFRFLITESKMFITNWVYLQSNITDKEALKELHNFKYPALKDEIKTLMVSWKDKTQTDRMNKVFADFESILDVEKEIMNNLVSFENYQDPDIIFNASDAIESKILPLTDSLSVKINDIITDQTKADKKSNELIMSSFNTLRLTIITLGLIIVVIGMLSAWVTSSSITKPIVYIRNIITQLGKGELPEEFSRKFGNDEIGEMALAVDNLVNGLKSTSLFAENIGKGNYKADYQPLSEQDVLGNSLINMRDNLEKVAEDDKKRSWATEGLAKFSEILRKNNDNIAKLSDEIISNLIKYLKANQGGLFIISDEQSDEPFLYLAACYAWDKKKYIEQKVYKGEGLTGQSWQEKDTLYITDVPDNYINITSGLGQSNPRCIIIVPLKVNDVVYGVIELASFNGFRDFEREFIEKIAESIASTISSVKINERTQILLQESTALTEQMRSQEEEMRQNMEELQATQEEMQRAQKEREDKELIINATNMMVELDSKFNVTHSNELVNSLTKFDYYELNGKPFESFLADKEAFSGGKDKLAKGNPWGGILKVKCKNDSELLVKATGGAMHDQNNIINKYMLILSEISES